MKALGDELNDQKDLEKTPKKFTVDTDWTEPTINKSIIRQALDICQDAPRRSIYEVLGQLVEEAGELATEINIKNGFSKKPVGKDGILGEAVDVLLCALDIIWLNSANLSNEELEQMILVTIKSKLEKWKTQQQ